jgi:hypothetical protein
MYLQTCALWLMHVIPVSEISFQENHVSAGPAVQMNTSSSLFHFLFMKPCLS